MVAKEIPMKIFHLSDLHIGKKLQGESLIEDQAHILQEILEYIEKEKPQAIILAGDIYDKSIPSAEAVLLLDHFLGQCTQFQIPIFIISGNHDSPERLHFGRSMFLQEHIYIHSMFRGKIETVELEDEYGKLAIHLLPFVKPAMIQPFYENKITSYEEGVRTILKEHPIDPNIRNILVAHQFVTNQGVEPERSDSERKSLGGIDAMDASIFDSYDYVALGHIHRPQKVGRMEVRYAGSPLKYSFSEVHHRKSITCIHIKEKGTVEIQKLPLTPLREMVYIEDTIERLLSKDYEKYRTGYLLSITVTNEERLDDPLGQIRAKFQGVLEFKVAKRRTQLEREEKITTKDLLVKDALQLFQDFYKNQNQEDMDDLQIKILKNMIEEMEQ